MWLRDEIDQLKKNWRDSTVFGRLLMGLSLYFTLSALASLSETVAGWKGFVLDAIVFYREWISAPILSIAKLCGLNIRGEFFDVFVIYLIHSSAYVRSARVVTGIPIRIFLLRTTFLLGRLVNFGILCIIVHLCFMIGQQRLVALAVFLSIALVTVYAYVDSRRKGGYMEEIWRGSLVRFFLPFFFVSLLGAVSSGLSR